MDELILNFPNFYNFAVKQLSNLSQVDAVSMLLLGKVREDCIEEAINDPTASCYVKGKKPIRKRILAQLFTISNEEAVRRVRKLGIQDIQKAVDALTTLVGEAANLSRTAKAPLLSLAAMAGSEYAFVAEVFLTAVRCPFKPATYRSDETMQLLKQPEQPASPSDNPGHGNEVDGTTPDSESVSYEKEPCTDNEAHFPYSHKAMEVTVSYRVLSIPEDKQSVIGDFLNHCKESLICLDYDDVDMVLSGDNDDSEYYFVTIRGTWESICFELSGWKELSNCIAVAIQLEISPEIGLDETHSIATSISTSTPSDTYILFGTKIVDAIEPNQVFMHGIFRIKKASAKDFHSTSQSDLHSESGKLGGEEKKEQAHDNSADGGSDYAYQKSDEELDTSWDKLFEIFNKGRPNAEPLTSEPTEEEDPYDDILKIFNKGHSDVKKTSKFAEGQDPWNRLFELICKRL